MSGAEKASAWLAYRLGLFPVFQAAALSLSARKAPRGEGKAPYQILNYHRVHPVSDPFFLFSVHPSDFEAQIRFLARHYRVFPLSELLARADDGTLPEKAIAIT